MGILYKKANSIFRFQKLKKIVLVIFMLLAVGCFSKLMAQESMIPEISNTFLNQLVDTAKKYYPIVKINQKRIEMAHMNIGKTNMSWFDAFTVTVNYSPSGGTTSLNQPTLSGFQVGFFINLGNILQKPYNIKLAKEVKRNLLEDTLNFTKDYYDAKSKAKIFMWKLSELKKNNP